MIIKFLRDEMTTKDVFLFLLFFLVQGNLIFAQTGSRSGEWVADNGDGTYKNPLLWGDWPDPDIIRVGDNFYFVSTSMHYVPGCPILESKDLVNWKMAGYAVDRYTEDSRYNFQGGGMYLRGSWAATIRYHNGLFYVGFCTPRWDGEEGHFSICTARDIKGPWARTIFPEYLYDPGLFFDDDGKVYVVHGQGRLYVTELSSDARHATGPAREIWNKPIERPAGSTAPGLRYNMEGSHVYKINKYYYITCPAGGTEGWQVCLRSRNIFGPYESKIILQDESSYPNNGLHQGGMVQLKDGSWWFMIMQDRGAIGRVPNLVPVKWIDGWPMLGENGNGKGVIVHKKPIVSSSISVPATSDEFSGNILGLQWQWNHNPDNQKWSLTEREGYMRLHASFAKDIRTARNTLTQRVQGPSSEGTVEMELSGLDDGDVAGLGIFQNPYAYVAVRKDGGIQRLVMVNNGTVVDSVDNFAPRKLWLRANATHEGFTAIFSYSVDGKKFVPFGDTLKMDLGDAWTANRFALFNFNTRNGSGGGYADFNWFRFNGDNNFHALNKAAGQSSLFNHNWKFIGLEFAGKEKVDPFRRLGVNWNDQFLIEKTNMADSPATDQSPDVSKELSLLNGRRWKEVRLPHIAFPEPLVIVKPREGIAYYKKEFTVARSFKGKQLSIEFQGVMQVSQVWVNGRYMGRFTGGYLPFEVDITDIARYGSVNNIFVKVNNRASPVVPPGKPVEKLDFVYYSGIYRDVLFHVKNPLHISNSTTVNKTAGGGIFVTYPVVSREKATVEIQTHIENAYKAPMLFTIRQMLLDKDGRCVASAESAINKLDANADDHYVQQLQVADPLLWHPDHPHLYTLRTFVRAGGKVVDERSVRIGIRSFKITREKGLLINDEPFLITGTNRHQNYPYIGNAISGNASYRDAWLIKSAGMNAVRMAHYPPDPSFLDAADELGILIINCIPGWQFFNQHPDFTEHVMQDIRRTIRRDRNHPSIVLWEVSLNETYPPAEFRCRQAEVAHSEWRGEGNFFTSGDSYLVKACWDVPYDDWNGDAGDRNNTTYPENAFLIREYGDYEFGGGSSTSRQLRSAGEKSLLQQAWNLQWEHNKNRKRVPRAIGDLTWAFYDGLAGCVVGIEGWGAADIFRIPKYSYYFFKSQQPVDVNPQLLFASGPMVYVASNWDKRSDTSKLVVYSNCQEVALYINGKLLAQQPPDSGPETGDESTFNGGNANRLQHPPFTFHLQGFAAGTVKAVGLVDGKPTVETSVITPGMVTDIKLEPGLNGKPWQHDGDIIFVYAKLADKKGQLVTESSLPVTIQVNGDAEVISPVKVDAEGGIASFLLRSGRTKGVVHITAFSGAIKSKPLRINLGDDDRVTHSAKNPPGSASSHLKSGTGKRYPPNNK